MNVKTVGGILVCVLCVACTPFVLNLIRVSDDVVADVQKGDSAIPQTLITNPSKQAKLKEIAELLEVDSHLLSGELLSDAEQKQLRELQSHPIVLADEEVERWVYYATKKGESLRALILTRSTMMSKEEFLREYPDQRENVERAIDGLVNSVKETDAEVQSQIDVAQIEAEQADSESIPIR